MKFFGKGWAQPVVSKPWAAVASITEWVKRASRYRLCVRAHHYAWERACGLR